MNKYLCYNNRIKNMEDVTPEMARNTPAEVVVENGKAVVKYEGDVIKKYEDTRQGIERAKGFAEGYTAFKK